MTISTIEYRQLVENSASGIAVLDGEGRVVYCSPSTTAVTGYPVDQVLHRQVWSFIHPQDVATCRAALAEPYARESRTCQVSFRFLNRAGDWRLYEATLGIYDDPSGDGGPDRPVVVNFLDVTEANDAFACAWQRERELEHVTRSHTMGELAAALSHELNQPFSAITSYLGGCVARLESGHFDPARIAAALREASAQATRAGQVMSRMREYVQRHEPQTLVVDLNEVIRSVEPFVALKADRAGCTVQLELGPDGLFTYADPILLGQVVLNIAFNAVEAIAPTTAIDRRIVIATDRLPNAVRVCVRDTGPGPPEVTPTRLFESFYTTKPDGLGLGLSLCRTIVESHQGHIWVSRDDEYTKFHVSMPVAA